MLTLQISVFLLTFWQECWHLDIYAFHNLAKCWHFDVHVFKKLISIVCFVAPPPVSRCLVLCFHHHALILATSSHNAILPYLSFKLVTSTYHIAFSPIYPLTLPLPWSNRVQLGSDRWLNQPQQALSLPSVIRSLCRRLFVERPQNATFVPFQPLDNPCHQRPALKKEQKAAWSIFPRGRTLTI